MNDGWIKLYRKITEWEWYTVPSMAHLFIHLLLMANQKDKRWKGILIKRGQLVTSILTLAEETGLSRNTVRRTLAKLAKSGEVTRHVTNQYSLITVSRYEYYQMVTFGQADGQADGQQHKNIRIKERKNTSSSPPPRARGILKRIFMRA